MGTLIQRGTQVTFVGLILEDEEYPNESKKMFTLRFKLHFAALE